MVPRIALSYQTRPFRFFEEICAQGECLYLRPQQRVPPPPKDKVIVLREGMLAIDAMPAKGKLQVLDFLVAGDVVSATVLPTPRVSLRAITSASLVALDPPEFCRTPPVDDYCSFLVRQCFKQVARVNLHQLMIGRLETESRVASFILSLALRNIHEDTPRVRVALPMSRNDIANYLVINCDTLSRTMMRFCDFGIIERHSRHAITVTDLNTLKNMSPLSSLLSSVFVTSRSEQENRMEAAAKDEPLSLHCTKIPSSHIAA
jgi:CRP/FNR family transcriptional regulator, anaerobic regulatory protein